MKLKPGVVTGSALQDLFAYMKEAECALPAVNVIGSHGVNAALQAANEPSPAPMPVAQDSPRRIAGVRRSDMKDQ